MFQAIQSAFKAYKNKWLIQNIGGKVEKETLAYWVDLSLKRAIINFNIMAEFRCSKIWPLNLERMQQKMGPSKTIYSILSKKLIEYEITKDNLPSSEKNARHFYIEEEGEYGLEVDFEHESIAEIGQFLKLLQKMIKAPKLVHEPLVDHSQN